MSGADTSPAGAVLTLYRTRDVATSAALSVACAVLALVWAYRALAYLADVRSMGAWAVATYRPEGPSNG